MGLFCPSDAVEGPVTHHPHLSAVQMVWAGFLLDHHHVHAVACVSGGAVFLMFKPLAEKQVCETVNQVESQVPLNVKKPRCSHKYFPKEAVCVCVLVTAGSVFFSLFLLRKLKHLFELLEIQMFQLVFYPR